MIEFKKDTVNVNSVFVNRCEIDGKEYQVLGIDWSCNLGFGRYELQFENDGTKVIAFSEYMDSNDNKEILRALLEKIADMAEVVE